jgi:hypothetical protein
MPTSMPYETGRGFASEKFERTPFNNPVVNAQGNYTSNASQSHSNMFLLEKCFHEADAAKQTSYAGSHAAMTESLGQSLSIYSGISVNMSRNTMSTSSFTNHVSRSVPPTQDLGGSFSIPTTRHVGSSRGKAPSTQVGNSKLQTPLQKATRNVQRELVVKLVRTCRAMFRILQEVLTRMRSSLACRDKDLMDPFMTFLEKWLLESLLA